MLDLLNKKREELICLITIFSANCHCDKMLEGKNLPGEKLHFRSWFRGFSPWLICLLPSVLVMRQCIMVKTQGKGSFSFQGGQETNKNKNKNRTKTSKQAINEKPNKMKPGTE